MTGAPARGRQVQLFVRPSSGLSGNAGIALPDLRPNAGVDDYFRGDVGTTRQVRVEDVGHGRPPAVWLSASDLDLTSTHLPESLTGPAPRPAAPGCSAGCCFSRGRPVMRPWRSARPAGSTESPRAAQASAQRVRTSALPVVSIHDGPCSSSALFGPAGAHRSRSGSAHEPLPCRFVK